MELNTFDIKKKEEGRRGVADEGKGSGSAGSGAALPTQSVSPISHTQVAAWLQTTVAKTRSWEGADLKVGGVELLQRNLKATAWIPGKLEDPSVVLRPLEGFNPLLRTSCWQILRHERPQE